MTGSSSSGSYTLFLRQTPSGRYSVDRKDISVFCGEEMYVDSYAVVSNLSTIKAAEDFAITYCATYSGHKTLRKEGADE